MKNNLKTKFQAPNDLPSPVVLHIRPTDEGEVLPHGGVTVSYILYQERSHVYALCGLSMCNEYDNFIKEEGVRKSGHRYVALVRRLLATPGYIHSLTSYDDLPRMAVIVPLFPISNLITESGKPLASSLVRQDTGAGVSYIVTPEITQSTQFLLVKESDCSITELIVEPVLEALREYRESTYEGDNEDVLSDIEDTVVWLTGMGDEDDGDEDGDDGSDDSDDDDEDDEDGN